MSAKIHPEQGLLFEEEKPAEEEPIPTEPAQAEAGPVRVVLRNENSQISPGGQALVDELNQVMEGVPVVNLKERAQQLLVAEAALGQVSGRRGLIAPKSQADWKKIYDFYEEKQVIEPGQPRRSGKDIVEKDIIPGAKREIPQFTAEADAAFDAAFGDYEAAKNAAWRLLSPEEQVELELQSPEREQLRNEFRAKHSDTDKLPVKRTPQQIRRNIRPKAPLKGAMNRQKLRRQMEDTLKRLDKDNSKEEAS